MSDILAYSHIVPLGAFCVAIAYSICHAWITTKKNEADLQIRSMEHEAKMKSMELEISRNNAVAAEKKNQQN